jgi:CoA:oxalate CoA-transferase
MERATGDAAGAGGAAPGEEGAGAGEQGAAGESTSLAHGASGKGAGPLAGVRVLDCSRVLSGPFCGRMLADLGADVIKLEPPDGDLTRRAQPRSGGISAYYAQQNAGKRVVSIDLRRPEGVELARRLAERSDVLVENYRPGVLERLGLGYEELRRRNPGLVYCSITGYGSSGPAAMRRAYAPVVHAEAGLLQLVADRRGTEPAPEVLSHADLYAGLEAVAGVLAALYARERSGTGCRVEISMADTLLAVNEWTTTELAGGDRGLPHPFGGVNAPLLRLADGTLVSSAGNVVATFPAWVVAMDRPELLEDPRFATPEARSAHKAELLAELQAFVGRFSDLAELEAVLGRARLPIGKVASLPEAATSPWAVWRGAVVELSDEAGNRWQVPNVPLRFSDRSVGVRGPIGWRGRHNREVLCELAGLSEEAVAALSEAGVVSERAPEDQDQP